MPNAPSDPAVTVRVLGGTAHTVLDLDHPGRVMIVRVAPPVIVLRETVPTAGTVRTVTENADHMATDCSTRVLLAETALATHLEMAAVTANVVSTSPGRVTNGVNGNPVGPATASRLVAAPMVSARVVTRGSAAHTETNLGAATVHLETAAHTENAAPMGGARNVETDPSMATARARMSAGSAMSVLS